MPEGVHAEPPMPSAVVPSTPVGVDPTVDPSRVHGVRELFWTNVIREMLTTLSTAAMQRDAHHAAANRQIMTSVIDTPEGRIAETTIAPQPPEDHLFDGRLAVITAQGTRIPIAGVFPLFACGIGGSARERELSIAVECTVFQIRTPTGEVYTLPLHEIRGFHALTPELVETLKAQAASQDDPDRDEPFGFAAFTSLARASGGAQARAEA
jgi:hypothetical protein